MTTQPPAPTGGGLALLSLILGASALVVPVGPAILTEYYSGYGALGLALFAAPVAIIAIVLGAVALRGGAARRPLAIIGMVLGVSELVVMLAMLVAYLTQ